MFNQPDPKTPEVGLTPLIDIVFILLIFVVLAANFDRVKGMPLELPSASHTQNHPPQVLTLSISQKGQFE
ncbi:MAG: biopolymer transporter ExbD, partial [Myxococcota bacterium]